MSQFGHVIPHGMFDSIILFTPNGGVLFCSIVPAMLDPLPLPLPSPLPLPGNIARLFKQSEDAVDIVMKLLSETHVDLTEPKPDGMQIQHFSQLYNKHFVKGH